MFTKIKNFAKSLEDTVLAHPGLTVLVLINLLLLCVSATRAEDRFVSPMDSVVALASKDKGIFCSAVSVGDGQFLTANHCLGGDIYVMLEKRDDQGRVILETWAPIQTIKTRPESDQAIVQTDDPSVFVPQANICLTEPSGHVNLMAIGFPLGQVKTRTYGEFVTLEYLDQKLQDPRISDVFYRTTVPIIGGNSGGGLFMEEEGEYCLTGLATAVMPVPYPMSWFSNLTGVKELLPND